MPVPRFPFPRCSCCTGTGAQLARLRAWQLTPALPAKPTLTGPLAWHGPVRALLALDDPRLADDCPPAAAAMLGCLAAAKATCRYRASSHKAWVLASHWYSPKRPRQSHVVGSCSGSSGSPAVFAAYAWHVVRIGLLALAASSAQLWLRRALPSPPSARAVRVLNAGALCAGVSRLGGSVASACFAVAAFSSRGARARRWCSLCWRKSLRRLGGFGVLCRRRLQLARCACSTLALSVLA